MEKRKIELTSAALHVLAMALMPCDHLWATVVPRNDWMTDVGRMAFPIFAFMIVEGYFHTGSIKSYAKRIFIFALLSEIPFNLVMGGRVIYPMHQNVLWSFLISLGLVHLNELAKRKGRIFLRILTALGTLLAAYIVGLLTMVDYYHAGILTVLAFYFFRGRKWWCFAGQLLCLYYINAELLGGFAYELSISGNTVYVLRQSFALFALLPIWLYRGRQGHRSKAFRVLCYAFYPLHLLILWLIMIL